MCGQVETHGLRRFRQSGQECPLYTNKFYPGNQPTLNAGVHKTPAFLSAKARVECKSAGEFGLQAPRIEVKLWPQLPAR